jgi:hypothetical protein
LPSWQEPMSMGQMVFSWPYSKDVQFEIKHKARGWGKTPRLIF